MNSIGMKAKFAIHPTNVEHINREFCPTPELYDYYKRMVHQFEKAQTEESKAAITFEGKMVDIAAYRRAFEIMKRYEDLKDLI